MNRFFSKLDLRDIKIDPQNTSFPPDADDVEDVEDADEAMLGAEAEIGDDPDRSTARDQDAGHDTATGVAVDPDRFGRQPHVPAWAGPMPAMTSGADGNGTHAADAIATPAYDDIEAGGAGTGAPDNGVGTPGSVEVLKVSARSRPSAVAGAIAGVVREAGRAEVQAIGAGATNQAVKAVAIARDYLRETGIEAICLPAFIDVTIENEDRTAIRLVVEPR